MKQVFSVLSSLFFFTVLFGSCAPKVTEVEKTKPLTPQLKTQDVMLTDLHSSPYISEAEASSSINSSANSSISQKAFNNMFEVSISEEDGNLQKMALTKFKKADASLVKNKKSLKASYYLKLVEEKTKKQISKGVNDAERKILDDTDVLQSIVLKSIHHSEKITASQSLQQQLSTAKSILRNIIKTTETASIHPELKSGFLNEFKKRTDKIISSAEQFIPAINTQPTLTKKLVSLTSFIEKNELNLDQSSADSLAMGQRLGASIDNIESPQTALQALAMTWKLLSTEEREKHFRQANEKLYNLFAKKDEADIDCIIQNNCKGLISNLIVKLGVYPALEDHGVSNIQNTLNSAASDYVVKKLSEVAAEKVSGLGDIINADIEAGVEKNLSSVKTLKENFKYELASGLKNKFGTSELGFQVTNDNQPHLQNDLTNAINKIYALNTRVDSQKNLSEQFLLIEKVLSLSDFATNKKEIDQIGLYKYIQNPQPLFLKTSTEDSGKQLQASEQAQALKFLSLMLMQSADWKKSVLDDGLSTIKAQDLLTSVKTTELNQSLFPKVELFNINLSFAIQMLKQFQSEKSMLYLIDNQEGRVSISQYLQYSQSPVALSAVSDKIYNRLENKTLTSDLYDLSEAFYLFLQATANVDLSASDILKDPELQQQLLDARKNIRLLILTLANFISHQMTDANHLVHATYDFEKKELDGQFNLQNQAASIAALVRAYEVTGIDIYLLSAKENYYALNRYFYDSELKFYKNSIGANSKTTYNLAENIWSTYNKILPLKKYLETASQEQFTLIFENWLRVFSK